MCLIVIGCMQDTSVYARTQPLGQARDDRVSCIQCKWIIEARKIAVGVIPFKAI